MYVAILGRQPALGIAELESLYGTDATSWFSDTSAQINTDQLDFNRLGGTIKAGRVVNQLSGDWQSVSQKIVQAYASAWSGYDGKITLGISAYGFLASAREVQKTGIVLKARLKKAGVNLRLVPNQEPALSSATSHHNKLGLSNNKVELLVVRSRNGKVIVAESIGSQNITALARRDQGRPKRDAFVGMLPPKLAQLMINLATGDFPVPISQSLAPTVLDPFCGTGVVLQEAALMGYAVHGTDLSAKMIDYSQTNLDWLTAAYHLPPTTYHLQVGDAIETSWQQPIDAVVAETYLGQPFSAPPSSAKLTQVRRNCDHIISSFLKNIASQVEPGTPLCLAVPAWRDSSGRMTHLSFIENLEQFGYNRVEFKNVSDSDLIYYREDQVVARQLLVLTRT